MSDLTSRIDSLILDCYIKSIDIILQGRHASFHPITSMDNNRMNGISYLEIEVNEYIVKMLSVWKKKLTAVLLLDVYILDDSNQRLVLIERWQFQYKRLKDSRDGRLSSVNRRLVTLMRTLYCYSRILPGFELLNSSRKSNSLHFNLYDLEASSGSSNTFLHDTEIFDLPRITTSRGTLSMSVKYVKSNVLHKILQVPVYIALTDVSSPVTDNTYKSSSSNSSHSRPSTASTPIPISASPSNSNNNYSRGNSSSSSPSNNINYMAMNNNGRKSRSNSSDFDHDPNAFITGQKISPSYLSGSPPITGISPFANRSLAGTPLKPPLHPDSSIHNSNNNSSSNANTALSIMQSPGSCNTPPFTMMMQGLIPQYQQLSYSPTIGGLLPFKYCASGSPPVDEFIGKDRSSLNTTGVSPPFPHQSLNLLSTSPGATTSMRLGLLLSDANKLQVSKVSTEFSISPLPKSPFDIALPVTPANGNYNNDPDDISTTNNGNILANDRSTNVHPSGDYIDDLESCDDDDMPFAWNDIKTTGSTAVGITTADASVACADNAMVGNNASNNSFQTVAQLCVAPPALVSFQDFYTDCSHDKLLKDFKEFQKKIAHLI